jgi:hypothetical protein
MPGTPALRIISKFIPAPSAKAKNGGAGTVYIEGADVVPVMRSGQQIRVAENAWTTHKVVRKVGQDPYDEDLLHLFDYGGTGIYTLTYSMFDTQTPQVQELIADDITEAGSQSQTPQEVANYPKFNHQPLHI